MSNSKDQVIDICNLLTDEMTVYRKRQREAVLLYAPFCFGVAMAILKDVVHLGLVTAILLVVIMGGTALIASQVIRLSRDRGKHCMRLRRSQLKEQFDVELDPYKEDKDNNDQTPRPEVIRPPSGKDQLATFRRFRKELKAKRGMTTYYESLVFTLLMIVCLVILHDQYSHTSMGH